MDSTLTSEEKQAAIVVQAVDKLCKRAIAAVKKAYRGIDMTDIVRAQAELAEATFLLQEAEAVFTVLPKDETDGDDGSGTIDSDDES